MYQKICVPIDGSKAAYRALEEAVKLVKLTGDRLHVVHVVDLTQLNWIGAEVADQTVLQEAVDASAKSVLEHAEQILRASGVPFECRVIRSTGEKVAELLLDEVWDTGCGMIAMGTHGFSGLMHLLLGSVAEGVIRKSKVPVLLVHDAED